MLFRSIITDKSAETINPLDFNSKFNASDFKTAIESKLIKDTFSTLKPNLFDTTTIILILNLVMTFGILYLLYSIYGMRAKADNIGHTAHFGGAIGGYAITISQVPQLLTENTMTVIILAIPIIVLFIMAKLGKL